MTTAVSVAYFDAYHSGRLPANLIQAKRDFFVHVCISSQTLYDIIISS